MFHTHTKMKCPRLTAWAAGQDAVLAMLLTSTRAVPTSESRSHVGL